ncbi:hypothetical protein Tco_0501945 [Tanacetum coccineum]
MSLTTISTFSTIITTSQIPLPPLPVPSLPLPLPLPPTTSPTYAEAPLGYRAAKIRLRAASPSTHHPSEIPSLPLLLPSTTHRDDLLEADMPLRKRACFTAPTGRFEVGESSPAATAARQPGHTLAHTVDYRFIDTMDASIRASESRAMTVVEGYRSSYYLEVSILRRERRYFRSMASSYECVAIIARHASLQRDVDVLQRQRIRYKDRLTTHIQLEHDRFRDLIRATEAGPQDGPEDAGSSYASAKLTRAELNKRSRDADLSKDKSGLESPLEFRRSWYVEGHIRSGVISSVLAQRYLRNSPTKGPSSGGTKMSSTFITVEVTFTKHEQPTGKARRVLPEFKVTGPQPRSAASFPPDNGHPSPTLVSWIENTSRTINIKPNKRPRIKKNPYPSPLPEQIFASATQQMPHIRKRSPIKRNFGAYHEGKHKNIKGKRPEQAELVQLRTIVGMIRGNTSRTRPREQPEQWLDNEISFPSTPGCQLVDSPIILEALIEGFLVRRIYVDGGSSSEVMYEHCF